MFVIVGLGNPGKEYENTRHNTGRDFVMSLVAREKKAGGDFGDFSDNLKKKTLVAEGSFAKEKITALLPEAFMNRSGLAVSAYIKSKKAAEKLIVAHDDLDLPIGSFKVSFGKNSGGHKGVESIMRSIKTKDFIRVRIGISPKTASGKIKKPSGEEAVAKFILGKFKPGEMEELKKVFKRSGEAVLDITEAGFSSAMGRLNQK